jgi:hypothetical protein
MCARNARVAREVPRHAEATASGPVDYGLTSMSPCMPVFTPPWNVQ